MVTASISGESQKPIARVVRGEPTETHRREPVNHRVEPRHAGELEREDAGDRERDVHPVEALRRLGDSRRELRVLHRSRCLGLEELRAAHSKERQDRDRKHDHTEAAHPDELAAPEVDRGRQLVEPLQHRRPSRGQPRHRLEVGVGEGELRQVEEQRQRGEGRQQSPDERDEQEPVADLELGLEAAGR